MIMLIKKYDSFRDLRSLQDEVNRLFYGALPRITPEEEVQRGTWSPNVDIFETKDNLVIEAELPGLKPEDFEISVENSVITISGERKLEKKSEEGGHRRIERSYGPFSRAFNLPQSVSTEGAVADFSNGILSLSLPKREEVKARKIEVRIKEASTAKAAGA